jgi:integrase
VWRKRLADVFVEAKIKGGHSHRFRDTFAVDLLSKGVSLESVSQFVQKWYNFVQLVQKHAFLLMIFMEARVGIEPTRKGFADLSLTTWVPRLNLISIAKISRPCQ